MSIGQGTKFPHARRRAHYDAHAMLPEVVDNRFEIGPLVGKGGYGEVYRAVDRQTGGTVAVKRLKGHFSAEETVLRFEREARALARTTHPRVVRYVAHGTDPHGGLYIATEWIEGELLSHRIAHPDRRR